MTQPGRQKAKILIQRLEKVIGIVKEAGSLALEHFGRVESFSKEDKSLVTKADIEVGDFLNRRLGGLYPGFGIINEETKIDPSLGPPVSGYTWVIDPIDGTASYGSRLPIWAVAVGLLRGIEPVMGVIYLPSLDEIYYTDEDRDAYFESRQWGRSRLDQCGRNGPIGRNSLICVVSYAHRRLNIALAGKVRSMGSTLAHICYVARGDAVAAVVKGAIWDIAPAWAILKKSGGAARYIDGSPLDLGQLLDGRVAPNFLALSCPQYIDEVVEGISLK
jgi:myo-inositol-1(or 4)-monophosphatase